MKHPAFQANNRQREHPSTWHPLYHQQAVHRVRTSTPFSVINTICSACALLAPFCVKKRQQGATKSVNGEQKRIRIMDTRVGMLKKHERQKYNTRDDGNDVAEVRHVHARVHGERARRKLMSRH